MHTPLQCHALLVQVGTARGGVSAFAIIGGGAGVEAPAAAAAVGAAFPGAATLRAVPLGVAVPPGISPAVALAAQTLCAADVPSLQHQEGGAEGGGGGAEEPPWREVFERREAGGPVGHVIVVRLLPSPGAPLPYVAGLHVDGRQSLLAGGLPSPSRLQGPPVSKLCRQSACSPATLTGAEVLYRDELATAVPCFTLQHMLECWAPRVPGGPDCSLIARVLITTAAAQPQPRAPERACMSVPSAPPPHIPRPAHTTSGGHTHSSRMITLTVINLLQHFSPTPSRASSSLSYVHMHVVHA